MGELRWILAGLGAALIAALYFWARVAQRRANAPKRGAKFLPADLEDHAATESPSPNPAPVRPEVKATRTRSDKIITLRLVPKNGSFAAHAAIAALEGAELMRGRFGIYHYSAPATDAELFSVASLVEPGSLEFDDPEHATLPGMSFFIVLPGPTDAVECFDRMVQTARMLAVELDGELFDDRGSSWSIQRERYVREELIQYRLNPARG
jgi:cell division protein ZipA